MNTGNTINVTFTLLKWKTTNANESAASYYVQVQGDAMLISPVVINRASPQEALNEAKLKALECMTKGEGQYLVGEVKFEERGSFDTAPFPIGEMVRAVRANAIKRGFADPTKPRDVPKMLMLIVSELAEAMEEDRNGRAPDEIYTRDGSQKPEGVPVEIADAFIRIADFAAEYGIDLEAVVRRKMEYNASRPHMHGGKAY